MINVKLFDALCLLGSFVFVINFSLMINLLGYFYCVLCCCRNRMVVVMCEWILSLCSRLWICIFIVCLEIFNIEVICLFDSFCVSLCRIFSLCFVSMLKGFFFVLNILCLCKYWLMCLLKILLFFVLVWIVFSNIFGLLFFNR